jgi:polyphosphate kinase
MATPLTKLYPESRPAADTQHALFINRDLSLIEFYRRVLGEALDNTKPLLERVKFISIFSSLIDEFYMIRIASLKERAEGIVDISPDGLTPAQQLEKLRHAMGEMVAQQSKYFKDELMPELSSNGIVLLPYSSLREAEKRAFADFFTDQIYPVLTPMAVDPSHPFPYISSGNLNIGLYISPELDKRVRNALQLNAEEIFVRMKVPAFLPRLVEVEGRKDTFVFVEDIIKDQIGRLITGATADDCHIFRITRDTDIEVKESAVSDLRESMEENLRQRRFGEVTRLEITDSMPAEMREYLCNSLELTDDDIYSVPERVDLGGVSKLTKLNRPELKDRPIRVRIPEAFQTGASKFDLIRENDILLHHPYMPYAIVTDFLKEASEDPDVVAMKICLYRLGADSPIPPLLIKASEQGKQVTALIELKARFDEGNNIEWARKLEEAGVHVIYGLLGLKTHAKTTLVVRREDGKLKRYAHIATGNYNPETSAAYTDLGLLTADDQITEDATELFNFLTVYSRPDKFRKLLVAPITLRSRMLELIGRETENAKKGLPARIVAKLNRLADANIVNALYDASRAGVQIDLIIRGICTLRPGIPGVSDNIRVRSVVGRLLEHSRVYYFENGGDPEVFMGSSDWMPRNLDRRVEVLVPIQRKELRDYMRNEYLAGYLRDDAGSHELHPDGSYSKVQPGDDADPFCIQEEFQSEETLFDPKLFGRAEQDNVREFNSKK